MKKKILLLITSFILSFCILTGCGRTSTTNPRVEAYEKFLDGEMDVIVENSELVNYPEAGTYSLQNLADAAYKLYYGQDSPEFVTQYSVFMPQNGEKGDDVLAIRVKTSGHEDFGWIGFIAFNDGKLEMKYCSDYGYRTFLELYDNGDVVKGGSGGAGTLYSDYLNILPDGSAKVIYKSATLYSDWCNEIFYSLDPDYAEIPMPSDSSILKIIKVEKDGNIYICADQWSDDDTIKAQEEAYVQELEELGAIVTEEATITEMLKTGSNMKEMKWTDQ